MTDRLYLLNPDWHDDAGGPWFCPPGAFVEGVLSFYPALREQLLITYLDHPRPRPPGRRCCLDRSGGRLRSK